MKLRVSKQEGEKVNLLERELTEHNWNNMRILVTKDNIPIAELEALAAKLRESSSNYCPIMVIPSVADINTYTFETDLSSLPTCELVDELKRREGVDFIEIEPYAGYSVSGNGQDIKNTGPAILFIVTD